MEEKMPEYPSNPADMNKCGFVENCDQAQGEEAYYRLIHKEERANGKIIVWLSPVDIWDDGKLFSSETVRKKTTLQVKTINVEDWLVLGKGSHSKDFDCYKILPPKFERLKIGLKNVSPSDAENRYNDWLIHLIEHKHTTEAIISSQSNQLEQRNSFLKETDLRKLKDYREISDYFNREFGNLRPPVEGGQKPDENKDGGGAK